jgi:hypothetical protein
MENGGVAWETRVVGRLYAVLQTPRPGSEDPLTAACLSLGQVPTRHVCTPTNARPDRTLYFLFTEINTAVRGSS